MWTMIDPGIPHPELRPSSSAAIPNLVEYVTQHRGEILHALLTLVRAWVAAGRPVEQASADDYGRACAVVRGILAVAGVGGVFDHEETHRQELGEEDQEWAEFLHGVYSVFGSKVWSVNQLLVAVNTDASAEALATADEFDKQPELRPGSVFRVPLGALPDLLIERVRKTRDDDVHVIAKSLGRWLANRDGRWAGDLVCRDVGARQARVRTYRITPKGEDDHAA
jgi:hypothetical protein